MVKLRTLRPRFTINVRAGARFRSTESFDTGVLAFECYFNNLTSECNVRPALERAYPDFRLRWRNRGRLDPLQHIGLGQPRTVGARVGKTSPASETYLRPADSAASRGSTIVCTQSGESSNRRLSFQVVSNERPERKPVHRTPWRGLIDRARAEGGGHFFCAQSMAPFWLGDIKPLSNKIFDRASLEIMEYGAAPRDGRIVLVLPPVRKLCSRFASRRSVTHSEGCFLRVFRRRTAAVFRATRPPVATSHFAQSAITCWHGKPLPVPPLEPFSAAWAAARFMERAIMVAAG